MTTESKAMGRRVQKAREARGWSQNQLTERAGVSDGYISRLEDGYYKRPSVEKLTAIANALNVKVTDLTEGAGEPAADDLSAHIRAAFGGDARKIEDFFLYARDLDRPDVEFVLSTVEWLRARLETARAFQQRRAVLSQ